MRALCRPALGPGLGIALVACSAPGPLGAAQGPVRLPTIEVSSRADLERLLGAGPTHYEGVYPLAAVLAAQGGAPVRHALDIVVEATAPRRIREAAFWVLHLARDSTTAEPLLRLAQQRHLYAIQTLSSFSEARVCRFWRRVLEDGVARWGGGPTDGAITGLRYCGGPEDLPLVRQALANTANTTIHELGEHTIRVLLGEAHPDNGWVFAYPRSRSGRYQPPGHRVREVLDVFCEGRRCPGPLSVPQAVARVRAAARRRPR